jgi:hypothetical protein
MAKTESDVLRECCEMLAKNGYFFWRLNNIPVYGRSLPKFTPRGLPDVMIVDDGKFYAVEFKRPASEEREKNGRKVRGGMLSPFQAEWAAKCVLAGGAFLVATSVEELRMHLPARL